MSFNVVGIIEQILLHRLSSARSPRSSRSPRDARSPGKSRSCGITGTGRVSRTQRRSWTAGTKRNTWKAWAPEKMETVCLERYQRRDRPWTSSSKTEFVATTFSVGLRSRLTMRRHPSARAFGRSLIYPSIHLSVFLSACLLFFSVSLAVVNLLVCRSACLCIFLINRFFVFTLRNARSLRQLQTLIYTWFIWATFASLVAQRAACVGFSPSTTMNARHRLLLMRSFTRASMSTFTARLTSKVIVLGLPRAWYELVSTSVDAKAMGRPCTTRIRAGIQSVELL